MSGSSKAYSRPAGKLDKHAHSEASCRFRPLSRRRHGTVGSSGQFFEAEALRAEYTAVLGKLVCALLAPRQPQRAMHCALQWYGIDPSNEAVHSSLMTIHYANGNRSTALRQFEHRARILRKEAGVPLSEALTRLYKEMKGVPVPQQPGGPGGRLNRTKASRCCWACRTSDWRKGGTSSLSQSLHMALLMTATPCGRRKRSDCGNWFGLSRPNMADWSSKASGAVS